MKITISEYETTISYEGPEDQTSEEFLNVIMGMMQALTWNPRVIIAGMKEIVNEYESSSNK